MEDTFKIRKVEIGDLDQVAVLFDEYRMFYGKETDLHAAKQFLSDRIVNNDSELFVAVVNDTLLAGFIQLYPIFSSTRMKRLWLLNDLYVNPTYRGKHISVLLIDKAKELSEKTNSAGLILETAKSNEIGNRLYPKTGFVLDEEHNYYYYY